MKSIVKDSIILEFYVIICIHQEIIISSNLILDIEIIFKIKSCSVPFVLTHVFLIYTGFIENSRNLVVHFYNSIPTMYLLFDKLNLLYIFVGITNLWCTLILISNVDIFTQKLLCIVSEIWNNIKYIAVNGRTSNIIVVTNWWVVTWKKMQNENENNIIICNFWNKQWTVDIRFQIRKVCIEDYL